MSMARKKNSVFRSKYRAPAKLHAIQSTLEDSYMQGYTFSYIHSSTSP